MSLACLLCPEARVMPNCLAQLIWKRSEMAPRLGLRLWARALVTGACPAGARGR